MIGMSALVLSKITSQVIINPGHIDVGLNLKFQKQNLMLIGYSRRQRSHSLEDQGGWEYSSEAIDLIRQYMNTFPSLFEMLDREASNFAYEAELLINHANILSDDIKNEPGKTHSKLDADTLDADDLLDEMENLAIKSKIDVSLGLFKHPAGILANPHLRKTKGKALAMCIQEWIKSLPTQRLTLVPASSRLLSGSDVELLEKSSDQFRSSSTPKDSVVLTVPLSYVYRANPFIHWSPSPLESFALKDRVLSLRSDDGIPFGTTGTVVGLYDLDDASVCVSLIFTFMLEQWFYGGSSLGRSNFIW